MNSLIRFREVLEQHYGQLPWIPVADGLIHRFHVPGDKQGSKNGWYCVFLDGISSGAFGSWKDGGARTWCSREPVDHREAEQVRQRVEQARQQRQAEQQRRQQKTARLAGHWWRDARRADPEHPYLVAKIVKPHGLRQRDDELLIPLYADGQLVNLQRIAPDGGKRFMFGGRIKGCYSPLGQVSADCPLIICEGWATAATLHEVGGYTVAAAMNAGNLRSTALALRARYPDLKIIIAGDDDRQPRGSLNSNTGFVAATAAAQAIGAMVMLPDWPEGSPRHLSDYNDLHCWLASQESVR